MTKTTNTKDSIVGGVYQQLPAGSAPQNRTAIYVTMHRKMRYESGVTVVPTSSPSVTKFVCPDRTLHIVTADGGRPDKDLACPIRSDSYDYCVYLDLYSGVSAHLRYVDQLLISAVTGIGTGFHSGDYISPKNRLLIDSGGAQLRLGTVRFLSPWMIIDWMNKMGGEGMALDVPPRVVDDTDEKIINELIEVQKDNNVVFKKLRDKDRVKLLNVSHGFDLRQMRRWVNEVADEDFSGLAAGNDRSYSMTQIMRNILVPALEAPIKSQRKRLHSFGISGGVAVPACTWLARHLPPGSLYTTDSSSWLVGCNFGVYYAFSDKRGVYQWNMHTQRVARKNLPYLQGQTLPCSCEVCHAVRWTDVFKHPSFATGLAMSYHNLFVLKSYEAIWRAHSQRAKSLGDYLEIVRTMDSKKAKDILGAVKYVDYAFRHGLDDAERRFVATLSNAPIGKEQDALFDEEDEEEQAPVEDIGTGRLKSQTLLINEAKKLESTEEILQYYRLARIREINDGKLNPPSPSAYYTGYEMTSRLITENRVASRKRKKERELEGAENDED